MTCLYLCVDTFRSSALASRLPQYMYVLMCCRSRQALTVGCCCDHPTREFGRALSLLPPLLLRTAVSTRGAVSQGSMPPSFLPPLRVTHSRPRACPPTRRARPGRRTRTPDTDTRRRDDATTRRRDDATARPHHRRASCRRPRTTRPASAAAARAAVARWTATTCRAWAARCATATPRPPPCSARRRWRCSWFGSYSRLLRGEVLSYHSMTWCHRPSGEETMALLKGGDDQPLAFKGQWVRVGAPRVAPPPPRAAPRHAASS